MAVVSFGWLLHNWRLEGSRSCEVRVWTVDQKQPACYVFHTRVLVALFRRFSIVVELRFCSRDARMPFIRRARLQANWTSDMQYVRCVHKQF